MGVIRTLGLLFFLTILVGGCILANTNPQPEDPVAKQVTQASWEEFITSLDQGNFVSIVKVRGLTVFGQLRDGTIVIAQAPSTGSIQEAIHLCEDRCSPVFSGNA